MHILITGVPGAGKSTLINKILQQVKTPVFGFRTKKAEEDADGNATVYIHPAVGEYTYSERNAVGLSSSKGAVAYPEIFESEGVKLLSGIPAGSVVLMDELGFMESQAAKFCEMVMKVLNEPYYVIAAVKTMNTPFLESVRTHKMGSVYLVTADNRDSLHDQIMTDLRRLDPASPLLNP